MLLMVAFVKHSAENLFHTIFNHIGFSNTVILIVAVEINIAASEFNFNVWVFIGVFGMFSVICVAIVVIMIVVNMIVEIMIVVIMSMISVGKMEVPMAIYYIYSLIVQQSFFSFH